MVMNNMRRLDVSNRIVTTSSSASDLKRRNERRRTLKGRGLRSLGYNVNSRLDSSSMMLRREPSKPILRTRG